MENTPFRNSIRYPGELSRRRYEDLQELHRAEVILESESEETVPRYAPTGRSKKIAIGMLLATLISMFWVGMVAGSGPVLPSEFLSLTKAGQWRLIENGLIYSGSLLLILGFHEMGHYLQARRYGIPASFPYFIPMPFSPFGTMGAVIIQGDHAGNRKTLFDIAVSGPLAGLIVALPLLYVALAQTNSFPVPEKYSGISYGDPIILRWMFESIHGPIPPGHDIALTPLLFAAWVGIFITALNLIPVGQLDGGHILYALLRRRAYPVAMACLGLALGYMIYQKSHTYALLVVLLFLMGPFHPPTGNDEAPLGWPRILLGWLTLAFIIVGFTPDPIRISAGG
jgi:membrane-associated protease RseP (regulator of RpoE activity)